MSPTHTCPSCGRANPNVNSFCAGCGASLSSREKGNGWKVLFGIFALIVGIIWAAVVFTRTPTPAPSQPQALLSQSTPSAPTNQNLPLTSAQHLAEAKRALAD